MHAFALPDADSTPQIVEITTPEPAEGEVRVPVHAASVNGFDGAVVAGYLQGAMEHRFPVVLGKDFAGVVDAVGTGVTEFAEGDRVFGVVTKPYLGDGSLGQYVTVPIAVGIAKLPESIDFPTGAALGLAGTTAIDVLEAAQLASGQVVLVAGATGGVGTQVVQRAAATGATVIATARTEEGRDQVRALGATEVTDRDGDIAAQVLADHPEGIDIVIHLAGDPTALLPVLAGTGRFVSTLLGSPDQLDAGEVSVLPVMASPTPATLDHLADDTAAGRTVAPIQRAFALDDAADAFATFRQGTVGKIVVTLD